MDRYQRWVQRTTPWLTVLAVLSLANFVLGAALDRTAADTYAIDYAAWAVFAVDYLVRLRLVDDRRRFVRSHPLDLFAVLVPAIRSLRVLAIFARVGVVAQRSRAERLLVATAFVVLTVVLVGAAAVLDVERHTPDSNIHTYPDAVWWALSTVTTVGYGDRVPVAPEGRIVGGMLMVVGIGTMGTVTAALAYRFMTDPDPADPPATDHERLRRIETRLDELVELLGGTNSPATESSPTES